MLARLGHIQFWLARIVVLICAGLMVYIAFNPAITFPYSRALGILALGLFAAFVWLAGRLVRSILSED
jgi:hypothetical protein